MPFVIIPCVVVALVITFPRRAMRYEGTGPTVDPSKVEIEIQVPGFGTGGGGLPGRDAPTDTNGPHE